MKYVLIVVLAALCVLSPYFCGRKSVSMYKARFNNVCAELGINERPFGSGTGYLRSYLDLNEPLSSTVSSLGLRPEVVDVFRDIALNISGEIVHGPKHLMWGAAHSTFSLAGKDWKVSGEEWITNKMSGASERFLRFDDQAQEAEGSLFVFQNCTLREETSGGFGDKAKSRILEAENFALWPGVAASGFRSEYHESGKGWENLAKASLLKLSEGRVSNLDLRIRGELLERGSGNYSVALKAAELSVKGEDLGAAQLELKYSGRSLAFLKGALARAAQKDSFTEALDAEDPQRFLQSGPKAELSLSAGGKNFSLKLKLSFRESDVPVSSWNDLADLLLVEAELEGGVPKELESLGVKADGTPQKITYDQGKLFVNGKEM